MRARLIGRRTTARIGAWGLVLTALAAAGCGVDSGGCPPDRSSPCSLPTGCPVPARASSACPVEIGCPAPSEVYPEAWIPPPPSAYSATTSAIPSTNAAASTAVWVEPAVSTPRPSSLPPLVIPPAPVRAVESAAAPVVVPLGRPYRVRVAGVNQLNLRAGPGTKYEIVATYPSGREMEVFGESVNDDGTRWLEVGYPEERAVAVRIDALGLPPGAPFPETAAVKKDQAELRVRRWDRATVVGRAPRGTPVTILPSSADGDGWAFVRIPGAARAFVSEKFTARTD